MKGTYQQIIVYMASRHPWMRDPVTAFDLNYEYGHDKELMK